VGGGDVVSKKVVSRTVAIVLGIICIVLSVVLVGAVVEFRQLSSGNATFKEPPPPTGTFSSLADYLNDLQSLGCKLINSNDWGTPNELVNYTEFRIIAYNTGVVFYYDVPPYGGMGWEVRLFTIFNGVIISFWNGAY
jgi:hypothetical protein